MLAEQLTFSTVKSIIEKRYEVFSKHGFALAGTTFEENLTEGSELTFRFINRISGLLIQLMFSSGGRPWKGIFVVQIVNRQHETLSVEDYLRLRGYVADSLLFTCVQDVPDFSGYANAFVSMLDRVFNSELKGVVDGSKWEFVPFDWQGYK